MATQINTSGALLAVHAHTYHRFMLGLKWVALILGDLILMLTISFATPTGFLGGLIAGAVVMGVGVYAMNHGLAHSSESDNPT